MAKTEKQEATILPTQVLGTVSPYPIVVTVIFKRKVKQTKLSQEKSHHSPPECIRIAVEILLSIWSNSILLTEVDKVTCKNQPEETNIEGGDQFLGEK